MVHSGPFRFTQVDVYVVYDIVVFFLSAVCSISLILLIRAFIWHNQRSLAIQLSAGHRSWPDELPLRCISHSRDRAA